ncbi:hypothetical protein VCRA2120E331_60047 [Vibrio crassostreae]|nr:hypothetical protein VCRA2120E331_60047 [Vibrio crassostreae]CAK3587989.1 hypothetical protein VCRA2127O345_60047 [Vibrio crassostreae]CAK3623279.1 hypothetical protein VCRA2122O338_60047 [Vibrio crassostreae]
MFAFSTFDNATLIVSMLIVNSLLLNIFYYLWVVANARTLTQPFFGILTKIIKPALL